MSYIIRNEIEEHLKSITDLPTEVLIEFCKLAINYMNEGPNERKNNIAAQKLEVNVEDIQLKIKSLVCFLIDCTKNNADESDFEQLKSLNFSDDQISVLWQFVANKKVILGNLLKNTNSNELRFRDLEWRVEAQIASRTNLSEAKPNITIKLHLDTEMMNDHKDTILNSDKNIKSTTKKEILLETDPCNLNHIISVLESAFVESKTHRTRNFIKAFQQQ